MWNSRPITHVLLVAMMALAVFAESTTENTRILGGSNATPSESSFVVRLVFQPPSECTGAIIGPRHILTAGHCVENSTSGVIYGGTVSRDDPNPIATNMAGFYKHPQYGTAYGGYDIAVIEVFHPLDLSGRQTSLALTNSPINFNNSGTQFGWSRCGSVNQRKLQKLPVSFLTKENCERRGGHDQYPQLLCVNADVNTSCAGDSGGPVISGGRIVGVHTGGANNRGEPITSQNVHHYLTWINSIVRK